jgi:FkbM family methyltransferase
VSLETIRAIVKPGMTVLDLGANVGTYTREMVQLVGPTGHVYAVEPCVTAYHRSVEVVPEATWFLCAVGAKDDEADLVMGRRSAQCSLYPANVPDAAIYRTRVAVRSVDSLIEEGRLPAQIDVVKMDVQGAECAVLRGATSLLSRPQTTWVIECWPWGLRNAGDSVKTLIDQLADAGLSVSICGEPGRGIEAILAEAAHMVAHESLDLVAEGA